MPHATFKPRLRPVEVIVVRDPVRGRVLLLRDTQGVASGPVAVPPALAPVLSRLDGTRTCAEIARDAAADCGGPLPVDVVRELAAELERALMLEGAAFDAALSRARATFDDAPLRPPSHAGAAYPGRRGELSAYIERECMAHARAPSARGALSGPGRIVGLVAPHIDPWRGAIGYGHAYGALARGLPDEADTFLVFGTSHAPMREPFALLRKGYDTPAGALEVDEAAVDALAGAAEFDPWGDRFNHKREHSIEFQAVFLRHVLDAAPGGPRRARIVPILAGLGRHQARGTSPRRDRAVAKFLDAARELVRARPGRVVVVAGADLAHVGPRFGDSPYDEAARRSLSRTDGESLALAAARDATEFFAHVARDLETRRVCGLAPIFSLLDVLPERAHGRVLHYEQTADDDGSIVSHAAVGFYA